MLAVVKTPHTVELALYGASREMEAILDVIRGRFPVQVIAAPPQADESKTMPVEATDWWKNMQVNRAGNLLAGARLKRQLTQAELAKRSGVPQSHISAMENGRLKISLATAKKLGGALDEDLAGRIFGENFTAAKPRVRKDAARQV